MPPHPITAGSLRKHTTFNKRGDLSRHGNQERPTVFSMRQLLRFPVPKAMGLSNTQYVGPVISVEPLLRLNTEKASAIRLNISKNVLHKLDPVGLTYVGWKNKEEKDTFFDLSVLRLPVSAASLKDFHHLEQTGVIVPVYSLYSLKKSS